VTFDEKSLALLSPFKSLSGQFCTQYSKLFSDFTISHEFIGRLFAKRHGNRVEKSGSDDFWHEKFTRSSEKFCILCDFLDSPFFEPYKTYRVKYRVISSNIALYVFFGVFCASLLL